MSFTPAPFESPHSVDKQQGRPDGVALLLGAPAGIRTPDTLLKRQVLCLLSYWGDGVGDRSRTDGLQSHNLAL